MNHSVQINFGNKNHVGDKKSGLISILYMVLECYKTVEREGKSSSHVFLPRHRTSFCSLNTANQHNLTIEFGPQNKQMGSNFLTKFLRPNCVRKYVWCHNPDYQKLVQYINRNIHSVNYNKLQVVKYSL